MRTNKERFLKVYTQETRKGGLIESLYANSAYCMSVDHNIFPEVMSENFRKMFLNGSGNELNGKVCAIYSSSMLAFNFFHWISQEHPFKFKKLGNHNFTKVYFEVQLPTLQGSTPANMDVVLEEIHPDGKRSLLFIESKFTEHFSNSNTELMKMSKNSYSKMNTRLPYYPSNGNRFKDWKSVINEFADDSQKHEGYYDGIKQEICHIIALSNLKYDSKAREDYNKLYENKKDIAHPIITGDEEFLFYNILFEPAEKFNEAFKFNEYAELYSKLKRKLSFALTDITAEMCSYRDVFDSIDVSNKDLKTYLEQRYMLFSK